jgi:cytochrome c biogenesis protein CcmG, thiol:disulfide interchange protein DsbE
MSGWPVRHARRAAGAVVAAIAAHVAACGEDGARTPAPVSIGRPAPAYRATTLEGDSISLQALRGKVVLLNVWATWCHPCREEVPFLQGLHERHASRGLELVGVSVDAAGEERSILDFARRYGMTYPVWRDPAERVSSTFLIIGVPASFLVGRDGTLLWRKTGPVSESDTAFARLLEQALAAPAPATSS